MSTIKDYTQDSSDCKEFLSPLLDLIDDKDLLKSYSKTVAESIQYPKDSAFIAGLTVVSSITCRLFKVKRHENDTQGMPIGIYSVIEQPPSTGKTGVLNAFQEPIRRMQKEKRKSILEHIKAIDGGDKALIEGLDARLEKIDDLIITNSTQEALEASLINSGGFFGAISSEQGLLNTVLGGTYGGKDKKNNLDVVLSGRFGDYIRVKRASREGFSGRPVGAICQMAQDGTIDGLIESSGASGLVERFICWKEPNLLRHRDHLNRRFINDGIAKRYAERLSPWLEEISTLHQDFDTLPLLSLSEKGYRLLGEFRQELEPHLGDGEKYSHSIIRGAVGKVDGQVLSIASNLHLMNHGGKTIDDASVTTAINIVSLVIDKLFKTCTEKGLIGTTAEFEAVSKYLEKKGKIGATRTEIYNSLKTTHPFKTMDNGVSGAITATIEAMLERGHIDKQETPSTAGQLITRYINA
jgi:hypothetical protein